MADTSIVGQWDINEDTVFTPNRRIVYFWKTSMTIRSRTMPARKSISKGSMKSSSVSASEQRSRDPLTLESGADAHAEAGCDCRLLRPRWDRCLRFAHHGCYAAKPQAYGCWTPAFSSTSRTAAKHPQVHASRPPNSSDRRVFGRTAVWSRCRPRPNKRATADRDRCERAQERIRRFKVLNVEAVDPMA